MFQTFFNITLGIFSADSIIKLFFDQKGPSYKKVLGRHAEFYSAQNHGFAMGRISSNPKVVKYVTLAAAITAITLMGFRLFQKGCSKVAKVGYAIALGGALSNSLDRFVRGYVVDYMHIKHGFFDKIIFNLSDVAIAVGSLTALIGEGLAGKKHSEEDIDH